MRRSRPSLAPLLLLPFVLSSAGCLSILPALAPHAKNVEENISADFPFESRYVEVHGSRMHYVDEGPRDAPVVVMLHGNPTSSYLWRNVIPQLSGDYRVIAPDMIGMGRSDQPDLDYTFAEQACYFAGFMEAVEVSDVTLVLHDWGGAVGLDWAARHEDDVRAVALMEAVVRPMSLEEDGSMAERYLFRRLRDPEDGHQIIAEDNYFVEELLPMMAGRRMSDEEMRAYREPYPTVESRKPVAQWPREIPFDGEPVGNHERIAANWQWLRRATGVPVLVLYAEPGLIFKEEFRDQIREELPRRTEVSVGSGLHFLQEVQPTRIGREIHRWMQALPTATR